MNQVNIMIIDNEEGLCRMMETVLFDHGYGTRTYVDPRQALAEYQPGVWDLVITDVKMPEMDGLELLDHLREREPSLPVIMITAYATVDMSIQALRKGAYDMLTKPFEPEELVYRVRNALNHTRLLAENLDLKKELAQRFDFSNIVGQSPEIGQVLARVEKVAGRDISVLITGESGTGKEVIARAIHFNSPRRDRRFIAINCGALPETVLESELFGYRKGAFTGANQDREGLLQAADGGTLFLDEVGNLPLNVQKTLLRFLEEREFTRLGDTRPTRVDVRLISATNADLEQAVAAGDFREDLFYRLNVVNLHLPPLRQRAMDIPLLANAFLDHFNQEHGTSLKGFTPEAMDVLTACPWPGNIRQLRNLVEAALAIETEERIGLDTLSQLMSLPSEGDSDRLRYGEALARFEVDYLRDLLRRFNGNVEEAAAAAGMNMATIYRKLKKYRLKKTDVL
ncbi:MAG: sigma-54-dependent Fis family transcriptional regulator [Deltaproteobacteria bacterium]|nr:MAG: sigma-54-dependent Fis family transcriptional regulator [Deltaproteobacteria bacterium]